MAYIATRHLRLKVLTKNMVNKSREDYVIEEMSRFTKLRTPVSWILEILSSIIFSVSIYANISRIYIIFLFVESGSENLSSVEQHETKLITGIA